MPKLNTCVHRTPMHCAVKLFAHSQYLTSPRQSSVNVPVHFKEIGKLFQRSGNNGVNWAVNLTLQDKSFLENGNCFLKFLLLA